MDLNTIWFLLIATLYTGYFVLEGFDLGVGILVPFLGKNDKARRVIINTIGPHWDGNEVWLIAAGGATFAAFPNWYATLFSGFYLPLFLMLLALIIRGIAFEFRSKLPEPGWRTSWDWGISISSMIVALLWGVAFANILRGVPIDENMIYVGGFWNLINPNAIVAGIFSLTCFILQGAIFLSLKIEGDMEQNIRKIAGRFWKIATFAYSMLLIVSSITTINIFDASLIANIIPIIALITLIITGWLLHKHRQGLAFLSNSITIILASASIFLRLFPNVMISSFSPEWNLTIYNSASSLYTLKIMTIIAVILVPIIIAYQGWSYWIFRKKISEKSEGLEY